MTYRIDGRTVTLPVVVRDAAVGSAMFEVDRAAAAALLPGADFDVVEVRPGRAQLSVVFVDYRDNDLGSYLEVGLTLFVRPRAGGDEGTFIYRLPVNQQFTCTAGREIWGFPKTVEDIAVAYTDGSATAELRIDGQLAMRLTVPRGGTDAMPELAMTSYTYRDGVPCATRFTQSGEGSGLWVDADQVVMEVGEHPVGKELAGLGLPGPAILSTWTEHMRGVFEAPRPVRSGE